MLRVAVCVVVVCEGHYGVTLFLLMLLFEGERVPVEGKTYLWSPLLPFSRTRLRPQQFRFVLNPEAMWLCVSAPTVVTDAGASPSF